MKKNRFQFMGPFIAVLFLIAASQASAQRRPGPPPGGGGGAGNGTQAPKPSGELQELGKAGDRFTAWRVANIGGAEYFTKDQEELRELYQEVEKKIREAATEDRLKEKTAREYLVMLLEIGRASDTGEKATGTALGNLSTEVQAAMVDGAKAETLTPWLNRLQWQIGEILLYGSGSSALSDGKTASINRRLISNEEKESSAKSDGKVSERELENLDEEAMKIWAILIKEFRKKGE